MKPQASCDGIIARASRTDLGERAATSGAKGVSELTDGLPHLAAVFATADSNSSLMFPPNLARQELNRSLWIVPHSTMLSIDRPMV
jgi:hypothetical protein